MMLTTCRASGAPKGRPQNGMQDLAPEEKQGWISYLRQCAGDKFMYKARQNGTHTLPKLIPHVLLRAACSLFAVIRNRGLFSAAAPGLADISPPPPDASKPRVTIVNRAHHAGRSIVTAPEALDRLQASTDFSSAQLVYMEHKNFREQVHFSSKCLLSCCLPLFTHELHLTCDASSQCVPCGQGCW